MLTINFIGGGRLGRALAKLIHHHHAAKIGAVVNTTLEGSREAIKFIGAGIVVDNLQALPESDITFITTRDDMIQPLCQKLVELHVLKPHSIVLHCSGLLSSDVLMDAKNENCLIANIHPVKSFADPEASVKDFYGTYCCYEGDDNVFPDIEHLFNLIGATVLKIRGENKRQYHAGAVMANNYMVTLHYHAMQNFIAAGIEEEVAIQLVSALMTDAFHYLKRLPHQRVLTGPIQRGDFETVKSHMDGLQHTPVTQNIYASLGLGTLPLTKHSTVVKKEFENILNGRYEKK